MLKRTFSDAFGPGGIIKSVGKEWPWSLYTWEGVQRWVMDVTPGWCLPDSLSMLVFDFARHTRDELQQLVLSELNTIISITKFQTKRTPSSLIRSQWWHNVTDDILLIVMGVRRMLEQLPNDFKLRAIMAQFSQLKIISPRTERKRWIVWRHVNDYIDEDESDNEISTANELRICILSPEDAVASVEELVTEYQPSMMTDKDAQDLVKGNTWIQTQRHLKRKITQLARILHVLYIDARRGYNTHEYDESSSKCTLFEAAEPLLDELAFHLLDTTNLPTNREVTLLRSRLEDLIKCLPEGEEEFPFGIWFREETKDECQLEALPECGVIKVPALSCTAFELIDFLAKNAKLMTEKSPYYAKKYEELTRISYQSKWTIWPRQFRWYCRTKRIDVILQAAKRLCAEPPLQINFSNLVIQFGTKNGRYRILNGTDLLLPPDWTHDRLFQTIHTWLPHRILY
jgi:hypothetical protein